MKLSRGTPSIVSRHTSVARHAGCGALPYMCSSSNRQYNLELWSGAFKHDQPQVLWPEQSTPFTERSHVLWLWRHNSRHTAWPTVILRFMETRWMALASSTRNLIRWIILNFMNNEDVKFWRIFTKAIINRQLTLCTPQFAGDPLGSWDPRLKP